MRYGARHAQRSLGEEGRRNARAHDARQGKKIERSGGNPTARDDLYFAKRQHTALRSLAHERLRA